MDELLPSQETIEAKRESMLSDIAAARKASGEAMFQVAIAIMRANDARMSDDSPPELIYRCATKQRELEQVAEKTLGREAEAWIEYFKVFGVPGEEVSEDTPTTSPQDWGRPG